MNLKGEKTHPNVRQFKVKNCQKGDIWELQYFESKWVFIVENVY